MTDIENRQDIAKLVNSFYETVKTDPVIGHFFTEVVHVHWDEHLPKMYDFWESIVFGSGNFKGNPMARHFQISQIAPIETTHFNHWLKLWTENADRLFAGQNTEQIKQRAQNIAGLMDYKIQQRKVTG